VYRTFRSLTRWQRARTVALGLIIGVGLISQRASLGAVLASLLPSLPPDPHVAVESSERECFDRRPALPVFARRFELPTLEPRIESRDGVWIGRDLFGTSSIEIAVDDPERAQAEALAWARSICDAQPRDLFLVGFRDKSFRDRLERACPSFDVCTYGDL
jgi:hypothetical protein